MTAVAILSMVLGIGVNTVVFSIVEGVLLRPFPYPAQDRLVFLHGGDDPGLGESVSGDFLARIREDARLLDVAAYRAALAVPGERGTNQSAGVEVDLFEVLGADPFLGSLEANDAGTRHVVLSYGFWRAQFGGDPDVVGEGFPGETDGTIAAVMPHGFFFPNADVDWWINSPMPYRSPFGPLFYNAIGRLAPKATLSEAQAEVDVIGQRLDAADAAEAPHRITLVPIHEAVVGDYTGVLWTLMGGVGLVLLIACANMANLLLARGQARRKELAVRTALGASRAGLIRQLLVESVMLASLAGGIAIAVAAAGIRLVQGLGLADIPRIENASLNWPVLAFGAAASVLAGLIAGIWPAWRASRVDPSASLQGGATASPGSVRSRFRDGLVVGEVAMALVLIVATGLLVRSAIERARIEWGFDADNVGVLHVQHEFMQDPAAVEEMMAVLEVLPGVASASAAVHVPLTVPGVSVIEWVVADGSSVVNGVRATSAIVTPGYFKTLGIQIQGREFTADDDVRGPGAVVMSESVAARLFPDTDPIGRTIHLATVPMDGNEFFGLLDSGNEGSLVRLRIRGVTDVSRYEVSADTRRTVIGVAADVRMSGDGVRSSPQPVVYVPYTQAVPPRDFRFDLDRAELPRDLAGWVSRQLSGAPLEKLVIRADQSLPQLLDTTRRRLLEVVPDVRFYAVTPMADSVSRSIGGTGANRLLLSLSLVFGTLSMLLAAVGIFGVMAYTVSQRTDEIGVRMTLGAEPSTMIRMVLGRALLLTALGLGLGLAGAWASTRLLGTYLYDVSPLDGIVFLAACVLMASVGSVAALGPAIRASWIDPVAAIRHS